MKEKTSKIIMITSFSIIGVLILAVILSAVISVNRGFAFNDKPDTLVVHYGDSSKVLYSDKISDQDGIYDELLDKLSDAGRFKVIDSTFGGYGDKSAGTEYLTSSVTFSTLYNESTEACLEFRWQNAQKTTYVNSEGKTIDYSYDRAYISLSSENGVKKINAYLRTSGTTNTYSRVVYYGYLNTCELYEYVASLNYGA